MTMLLLKLREVRSSPPLSVPDNEESQHHQDEDERPKGDADFRSQTDRAVVKPLRVDGSNRTRGGDIDEIVREDVAFGRHGYIRNRLLLAACLEDSEDYDELANQLHEKAQSKVTHSLLDIPVHLLGDTLCNP